MMIRAVMGLAVVVTLAGCASSSVDESMAIDEAATTGSSNEPQDGSTTVLVPRAPAHWPHVRLPTTRYTVAFEEGTAVAYARRDGEQMKFVCHADERAAVSGKLGASSSLQGQARSSSVTLYCPSEERQRERPLCTLLIGQEPAEGTLGDVTAFCAYDAPRWTKLLVGYVDPGSNEPAKVPVEIRFGRDALGDPLALFRHIEAPVRALLGQDAGSEPLTRVEAHATRTRTAATIELRFEKRHFLDDVPGPTASLLAEDGSILPREKLAVRLREAIAGR